MRLSRSLLITSLIITACSTTPWNSIEGLDEGEDYQRLDVLSEKSQPQVFSALEGGAEAVTEKKAAQELSAGKVLLLVRTGACPACDAMEETLSDLEEVEDLAGHRWSRLEVQGDSPKAKYRSAVVPTLIVLENGVEKARLLGNRKASRVRGFIRESVETR